MNDAGDGDARRDMPDDSMLTHTGVGPLDRSSDSAVNMGGSEGGHGVPADDGNGPHSPPKMRRRMGPAGGQPSLPCQRPFPLPRPHAARCCSARCCPAPRLTVSTLRAHPRTAGDTAAEEEHQVALQAHHAQAEVQGASPSWRQAAAGGGGVCVRGHAR